MKKTMLRDIALLGLATILLAPVVTMAGDLNPPAGPTAAESAMYSTDNIYNRLKYGEGDADGNAKRSGDFVEPSAGPANGVGITLNEIMAEAPEADTVNGATQADVVSGKTYWSLRTGSGNGTDSSWGWNVGTRAPAPAPVARSGQTTSSAAGDDGDLQQGAALPSPRFTYNGNGTVTDNLTGLIWLRDANCFGTVDWDTALNAAATLNSGECDLGDGSVAGNWRLPNQKELASLVNLQYATPALSNTAGTAKWTAGDPFTNVEIDLYWSSSTYVFDMTNATAWVVNLGFGTVETVAKTDDAYIVWPVRGGQ